MSKSRTRTLLLSILTLCIATSIVVGSTFALFTDTVPVNNHLSAGNLEVGLFRTSYQTYELGANGIMATSTADTTRVDLSNSAEKIFNVDKAVPTSWYEAKLEVSNLGSTAFDYSMKILWNQAGTADANQLAFADQMQITVTSNKLTAPIVFKLSECNDQNISLGYILKTATAPDTITIRAEFLNVDGNNSAMLATLNFDVQIYAVQKTSLS